MSQPTWEDVNVPRGAYISWDRQPGQSVTGKVIDYDPEGGTDFAGKTCPQLSVELVEAAYSVNKDGIRTDHAAGEIVVLNGGQVSLKRAFRAADPHNGDLVKIGFVNTVPTTNGTVKEFDIKIARGQGGSARPAPQQAAPQAQPAPAQQAPQPVAQQPAAAPQYTPEQIAAAAAAGIPLPGVS